MKLTTTIEFKSEPDMFEKESKGIKNNTVRFVNKDEDKKILAVFNNIKYIRIIKANSEYITSFIRTITDITRYVNPEDLKIIYIFTWEV
jgi:hypothetical protein